MKIAPHETKLVGYWTADTGQIRSDATCERIQWLTTNYLRKVAVSEQWGGWETLFQDPGDGRYWEQTYPQGHMHGGGPPQLKYLSREEAAKKYGDDL